MTDNPSYPECLRRPDASRRHVQTRTAQTEARYRARFAGMIGTLCKKHRRPSADAADLAIDLGERAWQYTQNTLKQLHAAIRQNLRDHWDKGAITLAEVEAIDDRLRAHKPARAKDWPSKARTSASRARTVQPVQIAAMTSVLLSEPTPIRRITAGLLEYGVELVTRPGEFLTIKPDTEGRFWVRSAKFSESNGKGLKAVRTVPTAHFDAWEIDELRSISELIWAERAKGATTQSLLRRCQNAIRLARKKVGGRSKRIVAYTVRQQGRANLVAMGMTPDEVAVIMGHASAGTAQSHYAPARRAWRGMTGMTPPKVDAALLAKVRPAHPSRGRHAEGSRKQQAGPAGA